MKIFLGIRSINTITPTTPFQIQFSLLSVVDISNASRRLRLWFYILQKRPPFF